MKLPFGILIALAAMLFDAGSIRAMDTSTSSPRNDCPLILDVSTMPITAGKVTLTVSPLHLTNGVYAGTYKINVVPYFFKNEKGKLTITASDESLAAIKAGKPATVTGTATTIGKTGRSRAINAIATPTDATHGKLKLWFMAGKTKMTFNPAYHLEESKTPTILAATTDTNLAATGTNTIAVSKAKP